MVPEDERVQPPPAAIGELLRTLWCWGDRDVMKRCGLDAYFFLRYLKTLLVIFLPILGLIMPVLVTVNFVDGVGQNLTDDRDVKSLRKSAVTGLDVLAWANIKPANVGRYGVHLVAAIMVVVWVCAVIFCEFKVYVKVRQDYLTSAEHRLRASAATVLVTSIPRKWCTERALRGMFDVFPGGVRNVWLNRDYSPLLEKIAERKAVHQRLETAETALIVAANKAYRTRAGRHGSAEQKRPVSEESDSKDMVTAAPRAGDLIWLNKVLSAAKKGADQFSYNVDKSFGTSNGFKPVATTSAYWEQYEAPTLYPSPAPNLEWAQHRTNTVRDISSDAELYDSRETRWWQFWRPPSGGFSSPVPQGASNGPERPAAGRRRWWTRSSQARSSPSSYPPHRSGKAVQKHAEAFSPADGRPSHRLPLLGCSWLPGLPLICQRVDTILWCRDRLAQLNLEIEEDQKHPERFRLLNSAFVHFNQQAASHMASQCVAHHVPRAMAPRIAEISPHDVVWDNMSLHWFQEWVRTMVVACALVLMTSAWAFPIAWTAALAQLEYLVETTTWLSAARQNEALASFAKIAAGVAPSVILSILLQLVPFLLEFLSFVKGAKTRTQQTEFMQRFHFIFLFFQVFFVVSLASFFTTSAEQLFERAKQLRSANDVLVLLATNIPKAANYFLSYMVLQALYTSSITLLQANALFQWFVLSPLFDRTPRDKWARSTKLSEVRWGSFFPTYTNFACIALVYCVISPLISLFAVVTFALLWAAQRYTMLYVIRFQSDTGGVLYPRALNQTFTGLYVMELCLAGLFFIVEGPDTPGPCIAHGVVMLFVFFLTVVYQILLNRSFGPLLQYLPMTIEDEAILRDRAFQRDDEEKKRRNSAAVDRKDGQSPYEKAHHYGGVSGELRVLSPQRREQLMAFAFQHEASRARSLFIWIPSDGLQVSEAEIAETNNFSRYLSISTHNASLDENGEVIYGGAPPDFSALDVMRM